MTDANIPYLHGFSEQEQDRLKRQGELTEYIIFKDIDFSKNKNILEVGSGVGVQTENLLRRFKDLFVSCIEINEKQIESAKKYLANKSYCQNRYTMTQMNAQKLSYEGNQFDGAFLCWVLEHVPSPKKVLSEVRRVLSPGSKIYITEVLNSSFFLEPYSPNVWKYWMAYNDFQNDNSGDPFIGAKLGNLLVGTGYKDIQTSVKTWHLDCRNPEERRKRIVFWKELLLSAEQKLLDSKYVDSEVVENMKKEFAEIETDPDSVFFYSFVQATASV